MNTVRIKRRKWRVQKRANWDECEGGCFLSCSVLIFLWSWLFIPATVGTTNCTKIGCYWKERSAIYCWNCELPRVCIFLCPTNFKNAKINKFILKKKNAIWEPQYCNYFLLHGRSHWQKHSDASVIFFKTENQGGNPRIYFLECRRIELN